MALALLTLVILTYQVYYPTHKTRLFVFWGIQLSSILFLLFTQSFWVQINYILSVLHYTLSLFLLLCLICYKLRRSTVRSRMPSSFMALMALLGLVACARVTPERLSSTTGAFVELRYRSGSATHPAIEGVQRFALEEFTANAKSPSWRGAGFAGEEPVRVALLKRMEDAEKPGNLLLKFAVAAEGEVFDLPEVSWNRRDEVLLAAGESWVVKLAISN